MNIILNTVQKKVGLLVSAVGLFVITDNFLKGYMETNSILVTVTSIGIWLLFLTTLPFVLSIFIESKILKLFQGGLFLFTGIINILDDYNAIYGPGMFFAAWLLMRHYGFFDNYKKIKYIIFLVFLIVLSQISAFIHNNGAIGAGFEVLEYTMFIVILVLIVWHDLLSEQKKLKVENRSLKINYTRIRDQLIELEKEKKPYNLKEVKITPAEERVIKILTIYKASNREIAERLNIAESTVKLHLYNIYNKIGVDNRFAIIDLCKYNYI